MKLRGVYCFTLGVQLMLLEQDSYEEVNWHTIHFTCSVFLDFLNLLTLSDFYSRQQYLSQTTIYYQYTTVSIITIMLCLHVACICLNSNQGLVQSVIVFVNLLKLGSSVFSGRSYYYFIVFFFNFIIINVFRFQQNTL